MCRVLKYIYMVIILKCIKFCEIFILPKWPLTNQLNHWFPFPPSNMKIIPLCRKKYKQNKLSLSLPSLHHLLTLCHILPSNDPIYSVWGHFSYPFWKSDSKRIECHWTYRRELKNWNRFSQVTENFN